MFASITVTLFIFIISSLFWTVQELKDFKIRPYYFVAFLGSAVLIYLSSHLTVMADSPKFYSPYSFISVFLVMMSSNRFMSLLFLPFIYLIWSFPLMGGQKTIPIRTLAACLLFIILSMAYLLSCFLFVGIYDYGRGYLISVYLLNLLIWSSLLLIHSANQKYASFLTNLLFHAIFFIWLSLVAFPWLQEPISLGG